MHVVLVDDRRRRVIALGGVGVPRQHAEQRAGLLDLEHVAVDTGDAAQQVVHEHHALGLLEDDAGLLLGGGHDVVLALEGRLGVHEREPQRRRELALAAPARQPDERLAVDAPAASVQGPEDRPHDVVSLERRQAHRPAGERAAGEAQVLEHEQLGHRRGELALAVALELSDGATRHVSRPGSAGRPAPSRRKKSFAPYFRRRRRRRRRQERRGARPRR